MLAKSVLFGVLTALVAAGPVNFKRDDSSLATFCTLENIKNALPANGTILGVDILPDLTSAEVVAAGSTAGGGMFAITTVDQAFCNVTVQYVHTGSEYQVRLEYAFPDPAVFENRYYSAGGGGYTLNSVTSGGLQYGAVSGATDAGYDALDGITFDEVNLYGNGTIDWDTTTMFAYQALGELTLVGKALTRSLYEMDEDEKLYTYFEGCSDGGREGMSQIQRYDEEYDGVITGAPAFRMALQQVGHIVPGVIETVQGHVPDTCALDKIVNLTITACDGLDGRVDGVIGRSDLCMLQFNLTSLIGETYYCDAGYTTAPGPDASTAEEYYIPAQEGVISDADIKVAQAVYDGLKNSKGEQAYLAWQIGSELADAEGTYNTDTGVFDVTVSAYAGPWVARMLQLLDIDNISTLQGVTYDQVVEWMVQGMVRYWDTLMTTYPDITDFQASGGKLLHYHGESDPSVPAASSVHYWQSVKDTLYPNMNQTEQIAALDSWYQLYMIPGYAHCEANYLQPGPSPLTNMEVMINWVENGNTPTGLNTTVSEGTYAGEEQMLCKFPLRPLWTSGSTFECVYDQASYDAWTYKFDAIKLPVF